VGLGGIPRTSIGLLFRAVLFDELAELTRNGDPWREGEQTELVRQRCYRTVLCDARIGLILS